MANESRVSELILRLRDEVSGNASKVGASLGSLQSKLTSFASALGVGVGVGSLVSFFRSGVQAAAEQEDAIARLRAALTAAGQQNEAYVQTLLNQASAFQRVTIHGDEAITQVQALLVSFGAGSDNIKQLTQTTLDFAAGMRIDLNTAALVVAKAMGGNTAALSRYGIQIDETLPKQERINKAISELGTKFAGQAAAQADTLGGKIKQLGNAWGELLEQAGGVAARFGLLRFLKDSTFLLQEFNEAASAGGIATRELSALEEQRANILSGKLLPTLDKIAKHKAIEELDKKIAVAKKQVDDLTGAGKALPPPQVDLDSDQTAPRVVAAKLAQTEKEIAERTKEIADRVKKAVGDTRDHLEQMDKEFGSALQKNAAEFLSKGGSVGEIFEKQISAARKTLDELVRQPFPAEFQFQELADQFAALQPLLRETFGINIPPALQQTINDFRQLIETAAREKGFEIKADPSQALGALGQVRNELEALRDKTVNVNVRTNDMGGGPRGLIPLGRTSFTDADLQRLARGEKLLDVTLAPSNADLSKAFGVDIFKPIQLDFRPTVSESPAVPFSRWLNDIAPSKIQAFVDEVGGMKLNFNANFTQALFGALDEVANARTLMAQQLASGSTGLHPSLFAGTASRLQESQRVLDFVFSAGRRSGTTGDGAASAGSSSPQIVINGPLIDMRDSIITRDAVAAANRELLPALESALRMTAGKSLGLRTLS